jgi:hypothetical protein
MLAQGKSTVSIAAALRPTVKAIAGRAKIVRDRAETQKARRPRFAETAAPMPNRSNPRQRSNLQARVDLPKWRIFGSNLCLFGNGCRLLSQRDQSRANRLLPN